MLRPGQHVAVDYLFSYHMQNSCKPAIHGMNDTGVVLPFPEGLPLPDKLREIVTAVHWDDDRGCAIKHPQEGVSFTLIRTQLLIPTTQKLRDLLRSR